jgi:SCY1-like protein 2
LCQITEALSFLHNQANCVHCNVSPSTIFITKNGDWKLGGFNFSHFTNIKDSKKTFFVGKTLVKSFVPDLDYASPEYVMSQQPSYNADVFSVGCLYVQLISGKQIINASNNVETYKKQIQYLPNLTFDDFSSSLQGKILN